MTQVAKQPEQAITIQSVLSQEPIRKRFEDMLGKRANTFMSSIISAVKSNAMLMECEPMSVVSSAVIAAQLDLPINSSLGFAAIVPFRDGKSGSTLAQFQMMYRGYVQLAIRSNQYQYINAAEVYEGELVSEDRFKGTYVFDNNKRTGNNVIGYTAYLKTVTGFEKTLFWPKDKVEAHAKKYSKSFNSSYSMWKKDFDEMAKKTVLKQLLSRWGIMSIEIQTANIADQAVIKNADTMDVEYVDEGTVIITYEDVVAAFEDAPKDLIGADTLKGITRIIENREEASYKKAFNFLTGKSASL